jgi:hypothetical protein
VSRFRNTLSIKNDYLEREMLAAKKKTEKFEHEGKKLAER